MGFEGPKPSNALGFSLASSASLARTLLLSAYPAASFVRLQFAPTAKD